MLFCKIMYHGQCMWIPLSLISPLVLACLIVCSVTWQRLVLIVSWNCGIFGRWKNCAVVRWKLALVTWRSVRGRCWLALLTDKLKSVCLYITMQWFHYFVINYAVTDKNCLPSELLTRVDLSDRRLINNCSINNYLVQLQCSCWMKPLFKKGWKALCFVHICIFSNIHCRLMLLAVIYSNRSFTQDS